jgi:hypothetical protein
MLFQVHKAQEMVSAGHLSSPVMMKPRFWMLQQALLHDAPPLRDISRLRQLSAAA